jgi:hypothetical protein
MRAATREGERLHGQICLKMVSSLGAAGGGGKPPRAPAEPVHLTAPSENCKNAQTFLMINCSFVTKTHQKDKTKMALV